MSRQHEHQQKLALYQELQDIMGAMKNMAQAEIHKLRRRQQQQQACLDSVSQAADMVYQHSQLRRGASPAPERHLWLLIGSERGFCGGFNEALVRELPALPSPPMEDVIIMGARLLSLLGDDAAPAVAVAGPASEKQVSAAITDLLEHIQRLQQASTGPLQLTALCHDVHELRQVPLLPYRPASAAVQPRAPAFRHMESLPDLARNIENHYLYHALLSVLYTSFYAENHRRLVQMEGALQHLDELSQQTRLRLNAQRQEEIVEEIEVIFASSTGF